MNNIITTS